MSIPAECDHCGRRYQVQERFAGEELPCKHCGEYFHVLDSLRRTGRRSSASRPKRSASGSHQQRVLALVLGGVALVVCGILLAVVALRKPDPPAGNNAPAVAEGEPNSSQDGSQLFPVASVPVPDFPAQLPPPRRLPDGTNVYFIDLKRGPANGSFPGSRMAMRVYVPAGNHAAKSLGCVLVAPAGSNLLRGNPMDADDYHDETLPYVKAGYAVVFYSIDGILDDPDHAEGFEFIRAYNEFNAAHAGVVNGRNALEFALARLPQVDPHRIYCAGHSSAGVLSLLLAEHEPRIHGCIAYAAASDVELRLGEVAEDPQLTKLLPDLKTFLKQSSPKTHAQHFQCPVFLFHALNDSNEPYSTSASFAKQLKADGKNVVFKNSPTGNHYQSMIRTGIPLGIAWLNQLPTEQGKSHAPAAQQPIASNSKPAPSNPPGFQPPPFRPPPFRPPSFQPRMPLRPSQRVIVFQILSYTGTGDAAETARNVLKRYPWCDANAVTVDLNAKQLTIGTRGNSINTGPLKPALQQAGFQLGGVSIRSQNR